MTPERANFAAYADPEREKGPPEPPVAHGEGGSVWNPCGGYYAVHRCARRGCVSRSARCTQDGKQYLVRCPHHAQAPWKRVGHALYKYPQCRPCQAREREEMAGGAP